LHSRATAPSTGSVRRLLRRRREEPIVEGFDAVAREAPPDSWSMEREQELWILRAVAALPRDQSRAIELAFFRGLTHVEIAERLGQPLGTVKTRIRLAMTKLRGLLRSLENRK
jgi:RNA polymerase sigma-70 factor (ECF subfamily)